MAHMTAVAAPPLELMPPVEPALKENQQDPQQQGALEHLWHVGGNKVSCQCWIPTVLPRAKDIRAHCSGHAARHVHDAAAGKVEEATLCE